MPEIILISGIMIFASFTQSVAGFGLALVAMPLLVNLIGLEVAAPFIAVISLFIQIPVLIRYRKDLDLRSTGRLTAAMMLAIPIGVIGLKRLDENIMLGILGIVVTGYAIYALVTPRLPELKSPNWAYPFGFVGGLLSGAYSTGGPPLVIYGNFSRWEPGEFKANLQATFTLTAFVQIASHGLFGNLTPVMWRSLLFALPGVAIGVVLGLSLDRHIDPALFRKIVLVLLIVLGLSLLF
ncbi:MAG: sulfite exporter TauE/SafE family protein [Anaerolineae bacterium]|nr:sulfite exporter TauE/SafE family protein [Anaerolineae bacterium]